MDQQLDHATQTQYFYILGAHYFQPTWREASSSINISTSICETLEFSALLLLSSFWEGALFHLRLLALKDRQLTEASGVCKPCLPDILMQHNPDVVVANVCPVFLMRMYAEREHTFGQKQSVLLAWLVFPGGLAGEESACNLGNLGSIPGLGRSPGERKGYPLQYPGLEKSCIVHGVAKSWTRLSDFHFTSLHWPDCGSWKDQYDIAYVCVSLSQGQLPNSLGVYPRLHHCNL